MAGENVTAIDSLTDTLVAPVSILTTVSSFIAVSWYNVVVINVVIFLVFKRWGGLYFYSLLIASWGIVLHQLGFLLQFFGLVHVFAQSYVVMMVGWYSMTTGQAIVLYSRLHLVTRDQWKFRWVLYMIITNAILFHIPTTTLLALTNSNPHLIPAYNIWQKIQVTAFSIQEFILAGLYIYEARRALKPCREFRRERVGQVMRNLIYVNVLVIILDIAVMCTQYAGMFEVHVVFKGAVYSVKLSIEFFVLNQLADATGGGALSSSEEDHSVMGEPRPRRVPTAVRRASAARSHLSARPPTGNEGGDQLEFGFFEGKGEAASSADIGSKSQVSTASEQDTSRLVSAEHHSGEKDPARSSVTTRRRDEWIELS